jgi:hypothetical protein
VPFFVLDAACNYINWLIPGILAQSAVFGASPTAYGLNNDRATGVIDRFRSLPRPDPPSSPPHAVGPDP